MPDDRTFIKLHDGMPDHPKVEGLSDKAFRLLVETWCWSSRQRTDGKVPKSSWTKRGSPAARRELVAAGLAHDTDDGIEMHDYIEHQRTAAQIATAVEQKKRAGTKGNHRRHHTGATGTPSQTCPECIAEGLAEPSQVRQQPRSQNGRTTLAPPVANGSQSSRTTVADTEESLRDSQTENPLRGFQAETDLPGVALGGDRPGSDASARATPPQELLDEAERQPCGRRHDPSTPCGACGQARRSQSDADAQRAAADRAADQRTRACRMCDADGRLLEVGRFLPVSPTTSCDHVTDHRQQVADARDEAS